MEIVRLKKEHYDELIALMNKVFSIQNKKEMDFERATPRIFNVTNFLLAAHAHAGDKSVRPLDKHTRDGVLILHGAPPAFYIDIIPPPSRKIKAGQRPDLLTFFVFGAKLIL